MRSILSFDLHRDDSPSDIGTCADRLENLGWKASFFVPTTMLETREFLDPLRDLKSRGFEIGTHSHAHSSDETEAIRSGGRDDLDFLERSAGVFADSFGEPARVFRSPCWAHPSPAALDRLLRLGYHVDSSFTPQRPGLLSSFLLDNRNMSVGRAPHFIRPGLLEVPTSTLLVPLGWPTFCTLRGPGSRLVTETLALEARARSSLVLVGQFHVSDLVPGDGELPKVERHWRDLIPRARGGIPARRWLRLTDRRRVAVISTAIMSRMARGELTTFGAVRDGMPGAAEAAQ